ncbi:MAG: TonB-dependent receptor [Blastocatellia bacterium]|nr:TonB-dependent receptor [Blastocatellia bacterium]MCS7157306.1 TonB-dependent receptor [Blastocatellia bacterium]MCX7752017.1 TonB-dependent receptor [Blastocatellia bacterium]MDW8167123.1 TonB-dependent receptor [Acidobacteriota bacterium]MDW8257227.1 TonB-dependent receptor [Acidobacteriota bacterium]
MRRHLGDIGIGALLAGMIVLGVASERALAESRGRIRGIVTDATGARVSGAQVFLRQAQRTMASTVSNEAGEFTFAQLPRGVYELVVHAQGFVEHRLPIRLAVADDVYLRVTLDTAPIVEEVTVTGEGGFVEEANRAVQPVSVITSDQILARAKAVLAQAVNEEVGVHLQRTSPTIAGIFIRGLGGDKVNVYVDGVRYSTSAMRSGIHTFLSLLDPTHVETIEVLRGPRSADYGSDALGGSFQLLTWPPPLALRKVEWHGSWATTLNTADWSTGSNFRASIGTPTLGLVLNAVGRRVNTLRPGRGVDSHSAVTRFLGLPSSVLYGPRLPDTGFTQYGGSASLLWAPSSGHAFRFHYQRGQQDGGKRFDQLLGGDGNLIADLRNLMLDFFYARYDRQAFAGFDHFSLSYSFNAQREERVNQGGNGNPRATIVHEYEKMRVHGVQARAERLWRGHYLRLGGEAYHERIRAPAFGVDPVTSRVTLRRPRVPDRARYQNWGIYVLDVFEPRRGSVKLIGGLRYSGADYRSRAEYAPIVAGRPLWPSDALRVSNVSGRIGLLVPLGDHLSASFHLSRGFRAPSLTDLGTLGLTGSGFEAAARDIAALGGFVGSTADRTAVSTGRPVAPLKPELSSSYELGVRYRRARVRGELTLFLNDVSNLIAKQALILPPGAVGLSLGGEPIVAQLPNGVVFVAASSAPVLVRANFGNARFWGIEQTWTVEFSERWSLDLVHTHIAAKDRRTGRPPNIEASFPAPDGWLRLRYMPTRRFWIEPYLHAAARHTRLSTLALEDRRTGATRSRTSIANFFRNGATVRGLVGPGPDGRLGTADDVLIPTGETLTQIQNRVLGPGVESAPLFRAIPGYVVFNVRLGVHLGENHRLIAEVENLTDRNYRGISWGLDAPGRSLFLRYQYTF